MIILRISPKLILQKIILVVMLYLAIMLYFHGYASSLWSKVLAIVKIGKIYNIYISYGHNVII